MSFPVPLFGYYLYAAVVAKNYLLTRVPSPYLVMTLVPDPIPAKLIAVHQVPTGGPQGIVLSRRRLIIWCYDTAETLAMQCAERVGGYLVEAMYTKGSGIRGTNIIGFPCYLPDPDDPAKTPRAQLTVDVTLRAQTS